MADARYYRHSGIAPAAGVISALQFGMFAAVVGGAVYGLIGFYNPFIYLNFLGALGLAVGIALAIKSRFRGGKVRSAKVSALLGAGCAVVALYLSWVTWLGALFQWDEIILNPLELPEVLQFLAIDGVWKMNGTAPTGGALYAIWGFEAVMILAMAVAFSINDPTPFCEECDEWTETLVEDLRLPFRDINSLRQTLEQGDDGLLVDSAGQPFDHGHHLALTINGCSGCSASTYLTVSEVKMKPKDDSENQTKRIKWISIDRETVDGLVAGIDKIVAEIEAAAGEESSEESTEDGDPEPNV